MFETIFLTGFPGFIAERLVARLAQNSGGAAHFLLLVQAQFRAKAEADIARIAAATDTPRENFTLLTGDITQTDLGLNKNDLRSALGETTLIFHLAAIYDLAVAEEPARRVNIEGTENVNHFARQVENLKFYHYVSTCYVAGKRTGCIYETELIHTAGFRNFYEETKYLAEVEVEKLKSDLPVVIHRPSVVCGDSRTGETAKYDGVYYIIQYLLKFPSLFSLANIGNRDVRLNFVPVDYVVEALTSLATDENAVGKTLQLADPDPLTTQEMFESLVRSIAGHHSVFTLPKMLVQSSLLMPFSPAVTGLPHSGVPYFFIRQEYDTAQARALLQPYGVSCPRFADYAATLVEFVKQYPHKPPQSLS